MAGIEGINLSQVKDVITHQCSKCGGEIDEIRFRDGSRQFDQFGITTTVSADGGPSTISHHRCPEVSLREDDLQHDADLERDEPQE